MPITKARLKISDYNETRKARLRSQERRVVMVSLSLTSMVDMFAILVIFLLANSASFTDWVKVGHGIDLPRAKSSDVPERAATIQIANDQVFVDDVPVATPAALLKNIEPLRKKLATLDKKGGFINIVGHDKIVFGVIKRIVTACQDSGFHRVNLAVQPRID